MDLEQNTSAIKKVFDEASDFILIGLTGRTGSGCSTTAQILANATIPLKEPSDVHFEGNERRKYKILKKYIEVNWKPFHWLQVRSVITRYLLTLNYAEFVKHTSNVLKLDRKFVFDALQESSDQYGKMHIKVREYLDMPETTISEKDEKKASMLQYILFRITQIFKRPP